MNVRKHLAGFAIFSIIVGCAIFINKFLNIPDVIIPTIKVDAQPLTKPAPGKPRNVSYKVPLVSLDFINRQSYTVLSLRRGAEEPLPEKLWVTTVFFSPNRPTGKVLKSIVEIRNPFANTDSLEYVATSQCEWCEYSNVPKDGYFARVYVSTGDADSAYPPDVDFDDDITRAIPVEVQAERKNVQKILR